MDYFDLSLDQPVLVVPDVHQNLDFLEAAVNRADVEGARLCFLGDFVDGANPKWAGAAALQATAQTLVELCRSRGDGCMVLVGNHDFDALRVARFRRQRETEGDTKAVAELDAALPAAPGYAALLELWPEAFLESWGLAAFCHDTLMTHAGVARRHWPWAVSSEAHDQAQAFVEASDRAWRRWVRTDQEHPLFSAGPGRGGVDAPVGGPLWLDWDTEFVDDLPFAQAVGHTRSDVVRRKDRSWCLDAAQTRVGLLHPDFGMRELRLL